MAEEKSYYVVDPEGKLTCRKCGVGLVKASAVFGYLDNAFPVQLPVCPRCGFVYVPEELAMGKVLSVEKVLEHGQAAREELESIEQSDETLAKLNAEKQALYRQAKEKAEALTQTRLSAFSDLEKKLVEACTFLNMPGVRFALQHTRGPLAGAGQDTLEFYISPNPGEAPKPLAKIASGGELSRIMLALKSALAEKDAIHTVIYDEIDTGVSGSAAGRIGQMLKQTAAGRQVICITHTAQIAALADRHLLIRKNVEDDRTYTKLYPLDGEGRVAELARIISGDQITPIALANAREMLGLDT